MLDEQRPTTTRTELKRNLTVWEAIGVSLALMAPSMAANINPQGTAAVVGRAVPLAYGLAMVGVLLIAYTFVRLCQRFNHSGSIYGFVSATLGPRWGSFAGWALLGTYFAYSIVGAMATGLFATAFLDALTGTGGDSRLLPLIIGALALGCALFLASRPARHATRVLLAIEGVTILFIVVICIVVVIKLLNGTAPSGDGIDLSVFTLADGVPPSAIFLGIVFGFLSFAGFEGAATLGEESVNPQRDIPRAILGTAIFGGVFFVVVTAIEVMAFGSSAAGVQAFANSDSVLGDIGSAFVASWVGEAVTLGAAISGFAACLASLVAAGRLTFAFGRDSAKAQQLGRISPRYGTPVRATSLVAAATGSVIVIGGLLGGDAFALFLATATCGTLVLLVAYGTATVGAGRLLFTPGSSAGVRRLEVVIPALSLAVLAYTLYRNVIPYPTGVGRWYPVFALLWLAASALAVLGRERNPEVTFGSNSPKEKT